LMRHRETKDAEIEKDFDFFFESLVSPPGAWSAAAPFSLWFDWLVLRRITAGRIIRSARLFSCSQPACSRSPRT